MLKSWDITIAIGTTSVMVLPANPRRISALIVNDHATNVLYLKLGKNAVANEGIRINGGGGSYEIALTNPWEGEVHGVANGAGTTTLINEVTS